MIIEWLLDSVEALLAWVATLFPVSSWNPTSAFQSAFNVLGGANYFFPVAELATLVVGFLVLGIPFAAVTLTLWVVGIVRGASVRA